VRKATEMPFNLILEAVPGAGALDPPRQALGRFRCRALALIGDARTAIQTSDSPPRNDNRTTRQSHRGVPAHSDRRLR
jgi:hypothetical protein